MLIKFVVTYTVCVNLFVLSSTIPQTNEQNVDKKSLEIKNDHEEDYDEIPHNDKTSEPTLGDSQIPEVFPENDSNSSISKNETALEILQSNITLVNKTVVENPTNSKPNGSSSRNVDDNKNNKENVSKEVDYDEHSEVETKKEEEEKADIKDANQNDKVEKDYDELKPKNNNNDNDVENIQETNQDQGNLEETYGLNETSINVFEEPKIKGGHIALIFATVLIFLSGTAYIGLILWRKNLELRYGMRQRLVTEDDYYNNNDVRYFGL